MMVMMKAGRKLRHLKLNNSRSQIKSNKKSKSINSFYILRLLVEVVEHIKPEVIVKAVVHTVAPVTVVPDVVEPTKKQPKKASL